MESDMLDYVTLRMKDLGQDALSADSVRENARAKAVGASLEFWSTGNKALLEQAFAETFAEQAAPPCETGTNGLPPSRRPGVPEKESKWSRSK
jgi:hypothetical protein